MCANDPVLISFFSRSDHENIGIKQIKGFYASIEVQEKKEFS